MRIFLLLAGLVIFFSCTTEQKKHKENRTANNFRILTDDEKRTYSDSILLLYDSILTRSKFNGEIIIAKNGQIIFERYVGYNNFSTKDTITDTTPIHVASVSKTFTAMAVLRLIEQGRIGLYDDVKKYLPELPYDGITINTLMNHRSGLSKYEYYMDKFPYDSLLTNQDLLNYIVTNKPNLDALPDKRYQYRNTNYALLAMIVERVTKIDFPAYMKDSVFNVLGMKNSFVFSIKDTAHYTPSYWPDKHPARLENVDCIYGDKNVYTTAKDLLIWDQVLYANSFVSDSIYQLATTPYSNERPSKHNYGYGWHLFIENNNKTVYHNGWWHGNMACFMRLPKDTATIIILTNKYNKAVYAGRKFARIFNKANDIEAQEGTD